MPSALPCNTSPAATPRLTRPAPARCALQPPVTERSPAFWFWDLPPASWTGSPRRPERLTGALPEPPALQVFVRRFRSLAFFGRPSVLPLHPLVRWHMPLVIGRPLWYFRTLVIVVGAALLLVRWFVELVIQLVS